MSVPLARFAILAAGLVLAWIPFVVPISPALIPPGAAGLELPPAAINGTLALPGLLFALPGVLRAAGTAPSPSGASPARLLFIVLATAALPMAGLIALVAATATPAQAISLGEMAEAAASDLELLPFFISVAFYILGVLLAGFGLLRLKRHVDHPSQTTIGSGLVALLIGAALIAAPSVINAVGETFAVDGATLTRPALDP